MCPQSLNRTTHWNLTQDRVYALFFCRAFLAAVLARTPNNVGEREGATCDEHPDGSAPNASAKIIQDPGEVPLVLYSDVRAPLASLSFLRRSLVMAELAMIAYNDEAEAQRAARAIGFPEAQLFDNDGSEAYRFRNEHDVVLACRGTEPTEWNDIGPMPTP